MLTEELKITLGVIVIVIMGLGYAARRYPQVAWLQPFNLQRHLTHQQRERLQRSGNVTAGAQLILLGIAIPLAFFALEVMFFSKTTGLEMASVAGASILCIALGIVAIVRNR